MAVVVASPVAVEAPTSRPYLAMGLTFLLLGIGFASPIRLALNPPEHIWQGAFSRETLNLYALTAFAGWGHFFYAWRGQWYATRRLPGRGRLGYWALIASMLVVLLGLRALLGVAIFSLLAWVYNIAHFVKAERFFAGERAQMKAAWWPVIAFAWFTLCLFAVGPLANVRVVFVGTMVLGALTLWRGGWQELSHGELRLPLLTLFLTGETLVWASYGPYMTQAFRVGVYIFHIAGASFFHYLSGYFYGASRATARPDRMLSPGAIGLVNLAMVAAGVAVGWLGWLRWLQPVLGVEWFTLWVALHLVASDLQPWWSRRV